MRPNVLLVILDAARRDAFEPYGAPAGSSPTTAQLARSGAALPEVYATGCWTVPSHASMLTGLMPRAAGLGQGGSPAVVKPVLAQHRDRLLAEVLRRNGYSTAGVSANLWVSNASGFDIGFDEFTEVDTGRHAKMLGSNARERWRWRAEAVRGCVDDGAEAAGAAFAERLAVPPAQPFLWFVNLIECHSPYLPPRPYGGAGILDRIRAADEASRYYNLDWIWSACAGEIEVPERTLARMRRLYAGSIRYMDDWLAGLLERMAAARILDDTIVIVTSDHGENLGEAGLITHAFSLDNRLIHVPMVIAGPGVEDVRITSLFELPRLIAELTGISDHPWHESAPEGCGVAQFDPPVDGDEPRTRDDLERLSPQAQLMVTTPMTCAVADGVKLLRRGEREEIYDLAADPEEIHALRSDEVAARHDLVARLRRALAHPTMQRRAPAPAPSAPVTHDEVDDLEERMRLLGYM